MLGDEVVHELVLAGEAFLGDSTAALLWAWKTRSVVVLHVSSQVAFDGVRLGAARHGTWEFGKTWRFVMSLQVCCQVVRSNVGLFAAWKEADKPTTIWLPRALALKKKLTDPQPLQQHQWAAKAA